MENSNTQGTTFDRIKEQELMLSNAGIKIGSIFTLKDNYKYAIKGIGVSPELKTSLLLKDKYTEIILSLEDFLKEFKSVDNSYNNLYEELVKSKIYGLLEQIS